MPTITITEKLWDAVRPGSVTKTGLSEAIRSYAKLAGKTPTTPKGFDEWLKGIEELQKVIDKTETVTRKASDDKKGAAAKLKTWSGECDTELTHARELRKKTALEIASKAVDEMLAETSKRLDEAIVQAEQLGKILPRGKVSDIKAIGLAVQSCRTVARDALKQASKDGIGDQIRTFAALMDWGTQASEVPFPPAAKNLRERATELQNMCEALRIEIEKQVDDKVENREGVVAELAEPLRRRYRKLLGDLKDMIPVAKKFAADAKAAGDKAKVALEKGAEPDKVLQIVEQIHERILAFENKANTLNAEGRKSEGPLMTAKREAKKQLPTPKAQDEFETIMMDEWNVCMVVYREISERLSDAYRQVDRMARLVSEAHPETATDIENRITRYKRERMDLRK